MAVWRSIVLVLVVLTSMILAVVRGPLHVGARPAHDWSAWVNVSNVGGPAGNVTVRDATFSDALDGWAVGDRGFIAVTHDGGASWATYASGITDDLRRVVFSGSQTGYVLGTNTLLHTGDGGRTWQAVNLVTSGATIQNLLDVASPAPNLLYLMATASVNGQQYNFWASSDGGATWRGNSQVSGQRMAFTSATSGWVAYDSYGAGALS